MLQEDHKEFIKKAKEEYKKIGYVECPAFGGEKVYFTNKGFNHLIFRDGKFRSKSDQKRRLSLLKNVINIVKKAKKYNYDREKCFWEITEDMGDRVVKIVIF